MSDSPQPSGPLLVGVDAMVIIWGVRDANLPSNDEQTKRVGFLFDQLTQDNARIVLPTPALTEILAPIDERRHMDFVRELEKSFVLKHLDVSGACLAAVAQRVGLALPRIGVVGERDRVKQDSQIVGACKSAGVTKFYSHDGRCRKMAEHLGMQAFDLPIARRTLFPMADLEQPAKTEGRKKRSPRK